MAGNWNAIARDARGEYLAILADDDRLLPGFVSTLVSAAEGTSAVLAFGNHHVIGPDGRRDEQATATFSERYGRTALQPGCVDPETTAWRGAIPACATLVRTADLRRHAFAEELNTPELELFVRLARDGGPFVFVPEFVAEYRTHAASATAEGLWVDRLATRLIAVEASPHAEALKRALLVRMVPTAVSRALSVGDRAVARALLRTHYYSTAAAGPLRAVAHRALALLPGKAGAALLALVRH
jgi:GT2 family glycosyltransferase